jgi:hypothetical protein
VKPARIASFPSLPQDGFPFWIFNPTNTASVHYRVATIAQYLLCKKNISIKRTQQTTDDYVYASLFSREDKYLSKISLLSFLKHAAHRPKIVLGLDQSTSKEEAINHFSNWNIPIDFYTPPEVASWHKARGNDSMAWFCMEHVFGFKLALNLMLASENNVFYADSDVLWFSDFSTHLNRYTRHPIYPSIDASVESLDFDLVRLLDQRLGLKLGTPPYGCAGVMLVNRLDLRLLNQFEQSVQIIRTNLPINRLTEQTLIAVIAAQSNSCLGEDTIAMNGEITTFVASFKKNSFTGRHYAGPWRSQFWIDALWQNI